MKGIVMEVDGKDLVVMKKNGEFIKMKKESQSARVGQEISVR
ncbi:MAG: anti-sigma factor domain-containing protein, partial [Peptostreptococcaceae bacterium]|nr:anti-sigma factor domain-containing protein [Peptostreptococcaceae bacterium]